VRDAEAQHEGAFAEGPFIGGNGCVENSRSAGCFWRGQLSIAVHAAAVAQSWLSVALCASAVALTGFDGAGFFCTAAETPLISPWHRIQLAR